VHARERYRTCISTKSKLGASSERRSGQRAHKRHAVGRWVPGSAWHFTCCHSRGSPTYYFRLCTCTRADVRDLVHVRSDAPVAAARAMLSRLAPAAMAAIKRAEDAEAVAAAAAGAAAGSITTLSGGHGGSMHFSHVDAADKQTDICDAAHGNLVPVKGVFEGADGALYIMFPAPPGTLQVRAGRVRMNSAFVMSIGVAALTALCITRVGKRSCVRAARNAESV
jgi:hypothetical protein